jgi:hypothetical protein
VQEERHLAAVSHGSEGDSGEFHHHENAVSLRSKTPGRRVFGSERLQIPGEAN